MIIVADWLPPEFGAVGQYMMQRARETAGRGHTVSLIGLGSGATSVAVETIGAGELQTTRLNALRPPRTAFVRRALWALITNFRLVSAVAKERKRIRAGEIVVTGSPPFLAYLLIALGSVWRDRITYRITDFYPEALLAAGRGGPLGLLLPIFHWMRKRAHSVEVLGEDQKRRLVEAGFPEERVKLTRDVSPVRITTAHLAGPRPYGANSVVLLYSGNLGVAHDPATFCEAYRRHVVEGTNRVRLWVNGTGARLRDIERFCAEHGLPLHVSPPAALDQLPAILKAADAHLVLLGDAFWGYVLPSKIYGCLDAGQPVLYVGPEESDVAMLIRRSGNPGHHVVAQRAVDRCLAALESLVQANPQRHQLAVGHEAG